MAGRREGIVVILAVVIGSLLLVALAELCRPRRRREFPALRRRLGNIGIWLLNLVLAAFTFAPPDTFRPQLEAALGVALPSWPIADRWSSFVAAFLLLDFLQLRRASLSARGAVPVALPRTASLRSRCRCNDLGAPSSDRVFAGRGVLLGGGAGARHPRGRRDDPRGWPYSPPPPSRTATPDCRNGWSAFCSRW